MRAEFEKGIDHAKPYTPTAVHLAYDPRSIALQQPVVQFIRGRLQHLEMKATVDELVRQVCSETEGLAFGGATLGDPAVYYVLHGCRSIEVCIRLILWLAIIDWGH